MNRGSRRDNPAFFPIFWALALLGGGAWVGKKLFESAKEVSNDTLAGVSSGLTTVSIVAGSYVAYQMLVLGNDPVGKALHRVKGEPARASGHRRYSQWRL